MIDDYHNGYIEKTSEGFRGTLKIEGIFLGTIIGGFYKDAKGIPYLWLKRESVLEYREDTKSCIRREARPFFECYAFKSNQPNIAYEGKFIFLHFTFSLVCFWDSVVKDRLNINIVRDNKQPLIAAINRNNNG